MTTLNFIATNNDHNCLQSSVLNSFHLNRSHLILVTYSKRALFVQDLAVKNYHYCSTALQFTSF